MGVQPLVLALSGHLSIFLLPVHRYVEPPSLHHELEGDYLYHYRKLVTLPQVVDVT